MGELSLRRFYRCCFDEDQVAGLHECPPHLSMLRQHHGATEIMVPNRHSQVLANQVLVAYIEGTLGALIS